MKKLVAISLFLFINALCFAQSSIRATGALGLTYWNHYKFDSKKEKTFLGLSSELLYNHRFKNSFFLESGFHYNQKGNKFFAKFYYATNEGQVRVPSINSHNVNYIGIPLRFGYYFFDKDNIALNFYVGAYYEYLLSARVISDAEEEIYSFNQEIDFDDQFYENLGRHDIGFLTGLSVEYNIKKLLLFFRAEYQQGVLPVFSYDKQLLEASNTLNKQPRNSTLFLRLGIGINLSKNKDL